MNEHSKAVLATEILNERIQLRELAKRVHECRQNLDHHLQRYHESGSKIRAMMDDIGDTGPVDPSYPTGDIPSLPEPGYIDIVFDGPPGPESGGFVEVEDENGCSISVGTWLEYEEHKPMSVLRIPRIIPR